ncbi:MAG: pyridoxal phosphate-dependent aminotransferase [Acidimicrobiales bacterium]
MPASEPMNSPALSRRVAAICESATLAIDAKAKALAAQGLDVVSFGAGEPDFPTPPHIVEAAQGACALPANHRYSPAAGLADLRQAVAEATVATSGWEVAANQVLITNGAKQAVYNSCAALLDPGDEVLLPSPYWVTYPEAVRLAGGRVVEVPSDESCGFKVSVEDLDAAYTPATKALLFVSPSNPTGAVYRPEEIAEIGGWAADRRLWVITDEIYDRLVYGSARFSSLAAADGVGERCIVINGVSKTYAMTGWRVGWMVGPSEVIAGAANLQSHSTSNVSNVAQRAALAAIRGDQAPVEAMRLAFDRRRRQMVAVLNAIDGVVCCEPEGAFYAFPSFTGVLGRTIGGRVITSTMELAEVVLESAQVAIVPGEAFGAPGYVRLSYALGDAALEEGLTRLTRLLAQEI